MEYKIYDLILSETEIDNDKISSYVLGNPHTSAMHIVKENLLNRKLLYANSYEELMNKFKEQIPSHNEDRRIWNYYQWTKHIRDKDTPYMFQFIDELSKINDEELKKMYSNLYTNHRILFNKFVEEIIKYFESRRMRGVNFSAKKFNKNPKNMYIIKQLLAYVFVIEAIDNNYFNRMKFLLH